MDPTMAFRRGDNGYYSDDNDDIYDIDDGESAYYGYRRFATDTIGTLGSSSLSNTTPATSTFDNPSEPEKSGHLRVRMRELERERWREREREIREREKERERERERRKKAEEAVRRAEREAKEARRAQKKQKERAKERSREFLEGKRHAKPYIEYYDSEEVMPNSEKKSSKERPVPGMTTQSWRRLHGARGARPFSARALIDIPNKDTISKDNTLGHEAWMAGLLARAGPNMRAMHIPRHTNLTRTGTPERPKRPENHVVYVEDAESDSGSSAIEGIPETRRYAVSETPIKTPQEETSDDWASDSDYDTDADTDSTSDAVHSDTGDLRSDHANTEMGQIQRQLPPHQLAPHPTTPSANYSPPPSTARNGDGMA
ncbi:hypothetical protein NM208_g2252 [Fusarium decemcellulare]|uniref:Uncharacterized protein n=1 Tax=Fusarium decemcellulare TaxID=57161 RepID=A0ACC1ST83_9HYPO|nr:hypothetical protein NM208_g2252 [Fusarium decemcellulare]